jgi:replicative DNA helicase
MNDRLTTIPYDKAAEEGVIGCVLLGAMEDALRGGVSEDSFYDIQLKRIWNACYDLYDDKLEINLPNVEKRAGKGLLFYLTELPDKAPTKSNIAFWLPVLRALEARRKAFYIAYNTLELVGSETPTEAILERIEADYFQLSNNSSSVQDQAAKWEAYQDNLDSCRPNGQPLGLKSGFYNLDRIVRGFRPGSVNVIAARPGNGKTALGLQIALHCAQAGHGVVFFSYEMPFSQLADRLVASATGEEMSSVHETGQGNWAAIAAAVRDLRRLPLYVEDKADCGISELKSTARRYVKDKGAKVIVIDYLQLIPPKRRQRETNRTTEVSELSREVKLLGQETGAVIFLLSQLNREVEHRDNPKPRLSDLRESGAIEQDADLCAMLYEPPKQAEEDPDTLGVVIAKNRHHGKGNTYLLWDKSCNRFKDLVATGETDTL